MYYFQVRNVDLMLEAIEQKSAQQQQNLQEKPKKSRKKKNRDKLDVDDDLATIREKSGIDSVRVRKK